MEIERLLDDINRRHQSHLGLEGRYAAGENQGAYAVVEPGGARLVLKWNRRPSWLAAVERARAITDRLRELGLPVPAYILAGVLPDGRAYWLQTELPGRPPTTLSESQLRQLLDLIELQAGQAISPEQDWSGYVVAVVFEGESGWAGSLRDHSHGTREVLARLERLVAGKRAAVHRTADIVHGDLVLDNVLVDAGRISGIVDWDAAGRGDRALDLAKLLFSTYDSVPIRERLEQRIVELGSRDSLEVYLAYAILAQLDWSIRHHGQASVDDGVRLANTMLGALEAARDGSALST